MGQGFHSVGGALSPRAHGLASLACLTSVPLARPSHRKRRSPRPNSATQTNNLLLILLLLLLAAWEGALGESALPSRGAAGHFTAGAARLDITPDTRLTNWITHQSYGSVLEPIFVRAVVLGQGERQVAVISWELLYAMEGSVAEVRRRVAHGTGIPSDHILVCATHNHSAPWSPILGDPLTSTEQKVLAPFLSDPLYKAWAEKLFSQTVTAVKQAQDSQQPATLAIGRAYAGEFVFNRRPRKPDGSVQSMPNPADPYVLPQGLSFGPVDPTLTVLVMRDLQQEPIVTLYHLPCHAVGIYPSFNGISGDWPGALSKALEQDLGGEAIFLQGCAGDIVPARRGREARDQMTAALRARAAAAARLAKPVIVTSPIFITRGTIEAPVSETTGLARDWLPAEVQTMRIGNVALVALPGEPLIGLATAIRDHSLLPDTLVLGYSNGYGVQYVGMPGEKARGGYEMGVRCLGKDPCGRMLVDEALSQLSRAP